MYLILTAAAKILLAIFLVLLFLFFSISVLLFPPIPPTAWQFGCSIEKMLDLLIVIHHKICYAICKIQEKRKRMKSMKNVTIYTDGACSGNPGPGGWGAILNTGSTPRSSPAANRTPPTTAWSSPL